MHRVLAFGCHPDDVEFMCAGTLALLAQCDCEIHIAVIAGGEMGSPTLPPAVIGAQFHFAGGYDIEVEYNAEYRRRAMRVMRAVNPTIVLTHPPMDYMIDHEETSRLVRNAAYVGPVPNYDCGEPSQPTSRIPHLYYWNAMGLRDIFGRPLPLTCAVDIARVFETKVRMLACHVSQREWLRAINNCDDYLELMRSMAEAEGRAAGRGLAEGFILHRGEGHPQDNVLKRLLGETCIELSPASPVQATTERISK
jgi:LmbE family N-acetylglucosaminyl deacetylase